MITWSSKTLLATALFLGLAGCDGGAIALPSKPAAEPLRSAEMLSGKLMLVPPHGYCIDHRSLKSKFALMARCDAIAKDVGTGGAPVGIIAVSVAQLADGASLPAPGDVAAVANLENIRDVQQADSQISFRADGAAPGPGYGQTHWRSVARVGTVSLGVSLHGPENGRVVSSEGRDILNELISRTRKSTK